jgi:hypothetical protein
MKRFVDFGQIRELCRQRFQFVVPRSPRTVHLLRDDTEQQLVDALADKFCEADVRAWFESWTSREDYLRAKRIGGAMYDADGFVGFAAPER